MAQFMSIISVLLGLSCLSLNLIWANVSAQHSSACQSITSCSSCIRSISDCVWCTNPVFEAKNAKARGTPRCDTIENHKRRGDLCKPEFLEISPTFEKILENRPVDQRRKVHISPQQAKLQVTIGKPVSLELTYLEDSDKRLDLYYILDLSYTMADDKDTVAEQSFELAKRLRELTKDVRFGFGSFVDKPVIPFASYDQLTNVNSGFVKPYGFKNHLPLNEQIEKFRRTVNDAKISANIDPPEGGFDALMQAIVCNQIGWRDNNTHRLIVIASDGPFHIAGDGRLGGIVTPNDMQCHLDRDGSYTHTTVLDYPSVGQLNNVVRQHKTYIIFAVTENHFELYDQLTKHVDKSIAARLEKNSNNVVDLVTAQYKNISGSVQLRALRTKGPDQLLNYFDTKYEVKCDRNLQWELSDTCNDVGPGKEVKFRVTLTLKTCPERDREGQIHFTTFELKDTEQLSVDLGLSCDCSCAKDNIPQDYNKKLLDDICGGNAKRLQCGKCVCDDLHNGVNCECSKSNSSSIGFDDVDDASSCRMGKDQSICSNRGDCECNQCRCNKGWDGPFCQCDQSKCLLNPNNKFETECNGYGQCDCGQCKCDDEHSGNKCQCPKDRITCKEPGTNKECHENGQCTCSESSDLLNWEWKCNCNMSYSGEYCHVCKNTEACPAAERTVTKCTDPNLVQCLKCHLKNYLNETSPPSTCTELCAPKMNSGEKSNEIEGYNVITLPQYLDDDEDSINCILEYNSTCSANFLYKYDKGPDRLVLQVILKTGTWFCRPPPDYAYFILSGAGGVILIGLLTLLLWKLFTFIHDKREFQRFEKERADAKWAKGENPLYNTPMSTFQNPAYRN